ncbi:MAG: response regulator, partial [Gammaproteobacteria bacterium]|nr:response regulator [Gammaproteobacteria bacterium]
MIIQQTKNCQEINDAEKMRILIVDDDPDVLHSIKDVVELEIQDCLVEVASNIEQAKLLAQQVKPDIALLDIKLGQDSGLDLIPEMKAVCPDISIIMMTAFRDSKYT